MTKPQLNLPRFLKKKKSNKKERTVVYEPIGTGYLKDGHGMLLMKTIQNKTQRDPYHFLPSW